MDAIEMPVPMKRKLLMLASEFMFDETDEILIVDHMLEAKRKVPPFIADDREVHFRPPLYCERWISQYSEIHFFQLFRMVPDTFEHLLNVISPMYDIKKMRGSATQVDSRKALLMTIFYLAHKDTLLEIADRFDVAQSTCLYEIEYIIWILVELRRKYIVWPREEDCPDIAREFEAKAGIPGVIGAIDGSHILLSPSAKDQMSYINRKMDHSIVLQGVCTYRKLFIDVSVGVPGRRHDAAVLQFSQLYRDCRDKGSLVRFYDESYHLLGDSAYPCLSWLLPPHKKPARGQLPPARARFNFKHSATRVVIENAFGLLKGRWQRLKYVYVKSVEKVSDTVVACAVLHNFCLIQHDHWEEVQADNAHQQLQGQLQVVDEDYAAREKILGEQKIEIIQAMLR